MGRLAFDAAEVAVSRFNRFGVRLEPRESIEQPPMLLRANQGSIVMLTVDLDEQRTDLLQERHSARLVVDKGAGFSVARLHTPEDDGAVGVDAVLVQEFEDSVVGRRLEDGRNLSTFG